MTQEQKARAYDEVVGKLKDFMAQGVDPLITRADVQDFFPEIKESKDERIRKEIIAFLTYYHTGQGNSMKYDDSWIDWLEKQGEDKEMNNFDVIPGLYKCIHRMFDRTPDGKLLFEVGNIYKCLSKHDRAEFEVSYGHSVYLEDPVVREHFIPFEKQGQKETTWNEEDEENMNNVLYIFNQLKDNSSYEEDDVAEKTINWLKSLKDRLYSNNEYDEDMLGAIEYCMKNRRPLEKEHITWLEDKLKSIRPQNRWKPSDKQLNNILDILLFDNCTLKRRELLESLYQDLKKLKEE